MTKFLALIPARWASSRFPGKPLAELGGRPMIRYVWERTAQYFSDCRVATDDERIFRTVIDFGGKAVMTSDTHRSGTDRCAEALDRVEAETGTKFDVVVNVQGDEPFVCSEHLEAARHAFDDPTVQIATLAKPFAADEDIFNPNTPKIVLSADGYALYFSRWPIPYCRGCAESEWSARNVYYKHIGLYAYRSDVLRAITRLTQGRLEKCESLEQLRWLENGYRIRVMPTEAETVAIDTPADLEKAAALLK